MKKINGTLKILVALILGIIFGLILNKLVPTNVNNELIKWGLAPLGNMFLRAIKMVVIPLVLCSLIVGTASIGDIKKLGRIGGKTILFYMTTTAFAVTVALFLGNILKPGAGFEGQAIINGASTVEAAKAPFIMDIFTNIIPTNPIEALVKGDMLQIIFFAILFGVAATLVGEKAKPVVEFFDNVNSVLLKIIDLIMKAAPIGVFALISQVIISQGTSILLSLFKYVAVVVVGLFIHTFVIYGGALKTFTRLSPIVFFKKFWSVMLLAFSTSSSNATIPVNIETCNQKLGVSEKISSFTIPLGATINMDGTAIMQGVAVMFIAQVFGIDLTFHQQLMVILTATLASIGTAGVPSAGVVMLTMVLQQVGLPMEGVALVLSVDRIVDMFRTTTNITGDAICTAIIAKSEDDLDTNVYYSNDDNDDEDLIVA
ncbi:dicarboxylate/amino acid:cation symporter [Clostridium fallax]|uniref:Na+/H+-dicarboxylate symporter n=1 Tax=Clostridium fallax TaxID=1533 RepID=A0A1M4VJ78_9CLOT|nr:dicarboxylate/amino acid:cation symporter [Clostridium fallax]SHE68925.1 Na+/H+-dicarboxylate symporter [Clostridium fallax]SQB22747.1 sodium:dicarboxylate symporter family protein [Clostridium fallax]